MGLGVRHSKVRNISEQESTKPRETATRPRCCVSRRACSATRPQFSYYPCRWMVNCCRFSLTKDSDSPHYTTQASLSDFGLLPQPVAFRGGTTGSDQPATSRVTCHIQRWRFLWGPWSLGPQWEQRKLAKAHRMDNTRYNQVGIQVGRLATLSSAPNHPPSSAASQTQTLTIPGPSVVISHPEYPLLAPAGMSRRSPAPDQDDQTWKAGKPVKFKAPSPTTPVVTRLSNNVSVYHEHTFSEVMPA